MSRRISGYERKPRDFYATPGWVTEALLSLVNVAPVVWEPASGNGDMEIVLARAGHTVLASDIEPGPGSSGIVSNFLIEDSPWPTESGVGAIVTNPPFGLADEFIKRAIGYTKRGAGQVIMLLPTDFDHAAGRWDLFGGCPLFAKKIILRKRIRWMEGTADDKGKQPMGNHAWFVWDWRHKGPPTIAYTLPESKAPRATAKKARQRPATIDEEMPTVSF